jgi:hypothetical protein
MKTLIISASPRDDGNSHLLARAALDGARSAGHDVEHVFLADYVERMLDNCRACRRPSDRLFCYTANSAPQQEQVIDGIVGKKVGVLISCEESYQGATVGVVAQFQELTRYLNQDLVGVVIGRANSRGEITLDPSDPVAAAHLLAERLYDTRVTDYRLDTERSNKVWEHLRAVQPADAEPNRSIRGAR